MKKTNSVKVVIVQDIAETDRKKAFKNVVEFEDNTMQQITAGILSDWTICKLRHYLKLARLQNEVGFKMNDPVHITISVNGKENDIKMKMSLNPERLEKALEKTPELVAEVFTASPSIAGLIAGGKALAIAYVNGEARKNILALPVVEKPKSVRKPKAKGLPKSRKGRKVLELQANDTTTNETSVQGELLNGVLANVD